MARPRYRAGDLFAVPFSDGTYATARVLLDVTAQCFAPRKVAADSALAPFRGAILVEVYGEVATEPSAQTSQVVIPGVFADPSLVGGAGKARWKVTGHVDVDPARVEFPEGLFQTPDGRVGFLRGEIEQVIDIDANQLARYPARVAIGGAARFVNICAYYTGRTQLLGARPELFRLASSDLRFTDHRDEVYRLMGEDPSRSYHDAALARGFDLARFYS
jgi:hypothetical protein